MFDCVKHIREEKKIRSPNNWAKNQTLQKKNVFDHCRHHRQKITKTTFFDKQTNKQTNRKHVFQKITFDSIFTHNQ